MNGMDEEKKRAADGMQNGGPSSDTAPETVSDGDGADIPTAEGSDVPLRRTRPGRRKRVPSSFWRFSACWRWCLPC